MPRTDYKATLQLPKTDFPMKANLPRREPETLSRWDQADLYGQLLKARAGRPLWVLHDGPPYANGAVHLGTALNKILKDFVVRSRAMMGFRTPFVPGWDCHGMPIEHRVSRELGARAREISKPELRKLCREYAEHWIAVQRSDFRRLGVIGDWANPYLTMSAGYDAAEIRVLRQLVEAGYIYRGLRPVLWCSECRTALAEAEVEYREHVSPSIYVAFVLNQKLSDASKLAADKEAGAALAAAHRAGKLFAVIWTTTPWTLPANLGICLNEGFDYVALKAGDAYYIVAARLAEAVDKACALRATERIPLSRAALKALDGQDVFRHPFAGRDVKLMFSEHVTLDAGTGLVHTAPGHGYEDFVVGERYGLEPYTPVDEAGIFTKAAGKYAHQQVFDANAAIVEDLSRNHALLANQQLAHSYPHCWRSRNPLIFRATEQWFFRVDHQGLRSRVLSEIDKVKWWPPWSRDRIRNTLETRPDWCLSRQRAWGVPIPALRCRGCSQVTLDIDVMKRVEEIFASAGSEAWFIRPAAEFVPAGYRCPSCGGPEFDKQEDVLDVWFDSGCSQTAVLASRPELNWPADAYLEAVEQARGWFGSSLLCAAATRGQAPFRNVVSHGIVRDDQQRKMSKSLGNAAEVAEAVQRTGADVIRLIYASVDYSADMRVGDNLFEAVSEAYRKLRNTCRFILGNLFDFQPARDSIPYDQLFEFDRFALARAEQLKTDARHAYERYDFQAAYQALLNFAVVDLSSLYIDVARDRLYCSKPQSRERRSAQTTLYLILDAFVRLLAPLLPFTSEEVYAHFPGQRAESVHLLEFQEPVPQWTDAALANRWHTLLAIRSEALKLLEAMRQAGTIGAPLEARLSIGMVEPRSDGLGALLQGYREQLKELFIVSDVALLADGEAGRLGKQITADQTLSLDGKFFRLTVDPRLLIVGERAPGAKCQRCWMYYDQLASADLCERCCAVLGVSG